MWLFGGSIALRSSAAPAAEAVSLAGDWRFALDRSDVGTRDAWFKHDLPDRIRLPGILQSQGYGDEIATNTPWVLSLYDRNWSLREDYLPYTKAGNVKVPFLCQPTRHYLGVAWYQREIRIPTDWSGRRMVLTLERPHWETTVWLDDKKIGSNNSLCAPHVYDLGMESPGRHRLTIRVDNRMILPYRPDSHSVSDSLGSSWNGIVGRIELSSTTPVWIEDARVFPILSNKSALVEVQIGNLTGKHGGGTLRIGSQRATVSWTENGGAAELEVPLGDSAQPWDEFHPVLQRLTVRLEGDVANDRREIVFGLREIKANGDQFILNDHPINLRGTHDGGDFPLTGYPPTDVESWKRIFRICQAWGLNHMRFHSWCPPGAAFTAADELGFYLQPECGMWNSFTPGGQMEKMLEDETARIIHAYGNHPSFLLLSPSNEPAGHWTEVLPKWVGRWSQRDPRRLFAMNTGRWSNGLSAESSQYLVLPHFEAKQMLRGNSGWFGNDFGRSLDGVTVPVLAHELGQWCAYPDYSVIRKFTGYLRPGNYEIFRDSMTAHGLLDRDRDFAWASGRFQLACYKEEIEANLRTPGLSGFQLLDLHDYIGQGTALVGLLDPFWETKGYAAAEEFRRFCGPTVLLARLKKRVFTAADEFVVDVEVAHFGPQPIANAVPVWRVLNADGKRIIGGRFPSRRIPLGKNTVLGTIRLDLSKLPSPRAYKLVVGLDGTRFENDWNFWLYPSRVDTTTPGDALVTSSWDEAEARLNAGGKVLFLPQSADLDWTSPPLAPVPVFWNRLMGPAWSRMLGLWCETNHPALADFPTEPNCDWQWTEVVRGARAINMDMLPGKLQPVVQAIDDWNRNHKLGLIFECRVGQGRLMICSVDLASLADKRPACRQLYHSLLHYMHSNGFHPKVDVSASDIRGLLFDTHIMRKLGATASADLETGSNTAAKAIDGDPNTYWLAGGRDARYPHELTIRFPAPVAIAGLVCMPRQNHREHEGDIREYLVQSSDDGTQWTDVARGELPSSFAPKKILFPKPVTVREVKFTARSGFGSDGMASLADLAVIYVGPKLADRETGSAEYSRARSATPEIDE